MPESCDWTPRLKSPFLERTKPLGAFMILIPFDMTSLLASLSVTAILVALLFINIDRNTNELPTTMSSSTFIIPIVALGVYRDVAAMMDPLFVSTPFRMTAILDLKQEPPSVRYSAQNLWTVLFNLHPRPKVFITGAAISHEMTAESITVWDSYVRESKVKNDFVINVSARAVRGENKC